LDLAQRLAGWFYLEWDMGRRVSLQNFPPTGRQVKTSVFDNQAKIGYCVFDLSRHRPHAFVLFLSIVDGGPKDCTVAFRNRLDSLAHGAEDATEVFSTDPLPCVGHGDTPEKDA
jgi:hypothetical protein